MTNNSDEFRTGAALLAEWGCTTREAKLEQACKALMATVEDMHVGQHCQSLAENLDNEDMFCSCADAYRMGHEALKS